MLNIKLKHAGETEQDKLETWLRQLLDGVENSNSSALRIAQLAHNAITPGEEFKAEMIEAIQVGIDNSYDIDVTTVGLATGAFDELYRRAKK